jgi:hypothetical protein
MDPRRANDGYVRLYADVFRLRPAPVIPLRPARHRARGHLRLVVGEARGSGPTRR